MKEIRVALLGFGNVGRALAQLFLSKGAELRHEHQISIVFTGVATNRHGIAVNRDGLDIQKLIEAKSLQDFSKEHAANSFEFIEKCGADVLFENSPVNYETGQPAVSHLEKALQHGMHAITANKGPVVHAYHELSRLARLQQKKFFFEATVMDGAPIFSLFREALPGSKLLSFKGILNSTTNMILTCMEKGSSFDEAVRYCQEIGIAETDPSGDIDGWDAAVKVAALTTVLMDVPLKPTQVEREGIRGIGEDDIQNALQQGKRWKLICSASRTQVGIQAVVKPELVGIESAMYGVSGTTSIVQFRTDVLGLLSVVESDPGPQTTAYGLFADFLNAVL